MTQFMLCVPDPDAIPSRLELRRIGDDEYWLCDVAHELFSPTADVRVPMIRHGSSISDVFTEAHNVIYNGGDFRATDLQTLLPEILEVCQTFVLWWGNEWVDLPVITSQEVLWVELEKQLRDEVGDVYLQWKRPA